MGEQIAVIAEAGKEGPAPVALELIAFARALRQDSAAPIRAWLTGSDIGEAAARFAERSGCPVTAVGGDDLSPYSAEAWTQALAPLLAADPPRFICLSHTADGADFAPGLAARLGAACITAVEAFRQDGTGPVFIRSVFNGKLQMEVAPEGETTVLTLLPGCFGRSAGPAAPEERSPAGAVEVEVIRIPPLSLKTRVLGLLPAPEGDADLAAAEVIVAAGRGSGGEETLPLLRRLAALFSHSALGASRGACDAGLLPRRCQIGQTGMTVAPRLYIACGISGAPQHLAGMRGARCITAINKDPGAALFQAADIAVVEEIGAFIPLLLEACGKNPAAREETRP